MDPEPDKSPVFGWVNVNVGSILFDGVSHHATKEQFPIRDLPKIEIEVIIEDVFLGNLPLTR
ncbi:MAG: hypothetical protein BWY82_02371 [Verrucomicrobia bacterium ADurb.Bin474]|nr:MAG: hypothetical protein BWY82_02371 [Verrucomicrobia bacterium ADurb.Bin474]